MRASRLSSGLARRASIDAAVDGGHLPSGHPDDAETRIRHARVYAHDEDHSY